MGRDPPRAVSPALADAARAHGRAVRGRVGAGSGDRHRRSVADRAHSAPRAAGVDRAARAPGGDSGLRRRLRLALGRAADRADARRHDRDDARHLSARLPAGGGGAAPGRSGARGDRPRAWGGPPGHVRAGHAAARRAGGARRGDPGDADRDLRVRGVRDPALSDVHHRDLQRVPVRRRGRRRAVDPAGRARAAGAVRRATGPAPGDRHQRAARVPRGRSRSGG